MTTTGIQLTLRDLSLIRKAAILKFVSTPQLLQLFFPTGNYHTAVRRITALCQHGFLSRVWSYPKGKGEERGHPTAIYFWPEAAQKRLQAYLEAYGQASLWSGFADIAKTYGKSEEFSQLYLVHELGISAFFLALEAACAKPDAGAQLVFWERTSPFSKDLGREDGRRIYLTADVPVEKGGALQTYKEEVPFNPDGFFCLQSAAQGYEFFFLELDNNTASVDRYRKKLSGYVAYRQERRFLDTLARYIRKYQLPISQPTNAFRVLTVTPDEQRRNLLFHDALKLASYKLLWFAALSEITPETILSPLWLRGKEYAPLAEKEKTLAQELTAAKRTQWVHEHLAQMSRVALLEK